jgi:hypothetical protein
MTGVDADMGGGQPGGRGALDDVEPSEYGHAGIPEVEHPAVAQPADRSATPAAGDVGHQGGQPPGDLGGGHVAALLGKLWV